MCPMISESSAAIFLGIKNAFVRNKITTGKHRHSTEEFQRKQVTVMSSPGPAGVSGKIFIGTRTCALCYGERAGGYVGAPTTIKPNFISNRLMSAISS